MIKDKEEVILKLLVKLLLVGLISIKELIALVA
jgi:hypothetical protein